MQKSKFDHSVFYKNYSYGIILMVLFIHIYTYVCR